MKAFDEDEVIPKALGFMDKAGSADKPFFVWLNTSRMHLYTRLNEKWRYAAEEYTSEYDYHGSGMLQHDHDIGLVLDYLKKKGLDKDTIVVYSTDNGPEHSSWPYGGTTPFRGEKMSTYEGGVRVPMMVRWPGHIPAGTVLNGIQGHQDLFTTLAAAAGETNVADKMMKEKKQYIDGINNLDYWEGKTSKSNRDSILYYYEDKLTAVRLGQWKFHFSTKEDYYANMVPLTVPKIYNLRADPFESYDSRDAQGHLLQKMSWLLAPVNEIVGDHLKTLVQYPLFRAVPVSTCPIWFPRRSKKASSKSLFMNPMRPPRAAFYCLQHGLWRDIASRRHVMPPCHGVWILASLRCLSYQDQSARPLMTNGPSFVSLSRLLASATTFTIKMRLIMVVVCDIRCQAC